MTGLTVGLTGLAGLAVGLSRLTIGLARLPRLPGLAGLAGLTVRRLAGLLPVPRRTVRGLTRLAVLRLTELARIWLPVCHGVSVGMRKAAAEGSMNVPP